MRIGLAPRFWQRQEVGLPGFLLVRQLLKASLDKGCTLAEFQPGVLFRHVTFLAGQSSLRQRAKFLASSVPIRNTPFFRWTITQSRPKTFQTQPPRTP